MIGTGYVGLSTGVCMAHLGHHVVCVDLDESKIDRLRRGEATIVEHRLPELLRSGIDTGHLTFTTDGKSAVADADFVFMCVQTPQGDDGAITDAEIIVNATSLGMGARISDTDDTDSIPRDLFPFDPALIDSSHVVADIVYHPRVTPLLRAARATGAVAIDGLGMLVHQAALQQRLWHGHVPDLAAMEAAAERELAARRQ